MKKRISVRAEFDCHSLLDFLDFFHLGSEKKKNVKIYCNDVLLKKDDMLHTGDILELEIDNVNNVNPVDLPIDILYEDDNVLIVSKPRGLLVHSDGTSLDDLTSRVLNYYFKKKEDNIISYTGRLDFDTKGIVLYSKNVLTGSYLDFLVSEQLFHREYEAITTGKFKTTKGIIEKPIGRDRHNAKKMRISETGKYAKTEYEVVSSNKHYNLVNLKLYTGRQHQIRLHLSSNNTPILGDSLYNGSMNVTDTLMLHAKRINFVEPISGKLIDVTDCDKDFEKIKKELNL